MTPMRLGNDRLPSEHRQHPAQPFLELDLGRPTEELPGARDVRLAHLWVVDGERLIDDLALRARDAQDGLAPAR